MRWCYDKRVLIGLGATGVAVLVLYPQWAAVVLPLLLVAACPLSMLLMMRMMNRGEQPASTGSGAQASPDAEAELAQLREEINILKAQRRLDHDATSPVATDPPGRG